MTLRTQSIKVEATDTPGRFKVLHNMSMTSPYFSWPLSPCKPVCYINLGALEMHMQVTAPPKSKPGDKIEVVVERERLTIVIPDGVKAGKRFTILHTPRPSPQKGKNKGKWSQFFQTQQRLFCGCAINVSNLFFHVQLQGFQER